MAENITIDWDAVNANCVGFVEKISQVLYEHLEMESNNHKLQPCDEACIQVITLLGLGMSLSALVPMEMHNEMLKRAELLRSELMRSAILGRSSNFSA